MALSPIHRVQLATAINPSYLAPPRIGEIKQALDRDPNRHVVLDDFLLTNHISALNELITRTGEFEPNLKITPGAKRAEHLTEAQRRSTVDRDTFERVAPADRFISQETYVGAPSATSQTRPARTDALVRSVFASEAFHSLMGELSGIPVQETLPIKLKRHRKGHFLRRHSDSTGGRKLCSVLYVHERWLPEFGGRFELFRPDGTRYEIDPLPNRLILFDVTIGNEHAVQDLEQVPDDWYRANYSVWFR
ncbi:2OG-Fe(II) oxygenase family protein [Aurantiacibacter sp. MUD61]|uniref:2OG-Fe(II) oxygenase family protein n=1 Tax=Aurantiacibacter sp. MUD61 TaxID=3009083 RepID=UPI0022F0E65C|nr:2OG-Fe(II) oxygenase family protein [Aurantiacibacter sp. MUD61]